ncbi:hypothetical protein V2J09_022844 [Rumex salicifolius]
MANELYSYHNSSYAPRYPSVSSLYTSSRSLLTEPYVPPTSLLPSSSSSSSRYLTSSLSDRYFSSDPDLSAASSSASHPYSMPVGVDLNVTKRSTPAFHEHSVIGNGTYNIVGENEAWLSPNMLAKRPRFESTINLPIYPQRPGEKDCAHYMLTRTCKFGDACKFDHPIWVPEGGIPDWKEIPQISTQPHTYPERPGEPDCPYFLKTGNCKFGPSCKFNHPKDKLISSVTLENVNASDLPERPSEPSCAFYVKTGKCRFGANCKFHHPKDITVPPTGCETGMGEQIASPKTDITIRDVNPVQAPVTAPALRYNSKGLPIRLGEVECPFYMKAGSCKYGATCRYTHPDVANNPSAMNFSALTSPAMTLNLGLVDPAASILRGLDPRMRQAALGLGPVVYPQRPGSIECDHYMKTGECKFGEKCKFHHPIDRSNPNSVKLTLAGLPRREGSTHCAFYMKTGTCKFGPQCRFDHPPPGEVMGVTTVGKDEEKGETT